MANELQRFERIVYVSWEESERGWGTRPDGCSLHLSVEDFRDYERAHWEREQQENGEFAPDEYERPAGKPVTAFARGDLYDKIVKSDQGIRLSRSSETDEIEKQNLRMGEEISGWTRIN